MLNFPTPVVLGGYSILLNRWILKKSRVFMSQSKFVCHPLVQNTNRQHFFSCVDQDLPSLPVPELQPSLQKYLKALRPIVSSDELTRVSRIVEEFGKPGGEGAKLHSLIIKRAESKINWLDEWWSRYGYLKWRDSIVVHYNPGVTYPKQGFSGRDGQIRFAAKFLLGILDYKKMIDSGTVPVEYYGKDPICMKQPYILMNSCRIPGIEEDSSIVHDPDKPEERAKHIIAVHNNQFFLVDVYDNSGRILSLTQMQDQMREVMDMSPEPGPPVGILTASDRVHWANVYNKMMKDSTNHATIDAIQKSILVLCLDKPSFHQFPDFKTGLAASAMHGSGSRFNSGNRWFDKPIQAIVSIDGGFGGNLEHLLAEAPPQAAMFDHALDCMTKKDCTKHSPIAEPNSPRHLKFNLSGDLLEDIKHASEKVDSLVSNIELAPRVFSLYGKDFIKHYKMSPDAYYQVCFQLAYYRLHGHPTATYETGSTKKFKHGRTETMRSCTAEALEFCKIMGRGAKGRQEKIAMLVKAAEEHSKLTKEVMAGQGIDRLFLGMKIAALENGLEVPELFKDPTYREFMRMRLSTSQVPSPHEGNVFFGPSEKDGYGLCYNPMSDRLLFTISAFKDNEITDAKSFADMIETTLKDVHLLLFGRILGSYKG